MGAADYDIDQGGSGCPEIRVDLLGGGAIGPTVWVRDTSTDTAHEKGVGWIPPQGGMLADCAETAEGEGRSLGLLLSGECVGRGDFAGGGDLCLPPPEHSCVIYCD